MSTQSFSLRNFRTAFVMVSLLLMLATPALAYFVPGNHLADYDTFYAGDAPSLANRPVLRVEYTVPNVP